MQKARRGIRPCSCTISADSLSRTSDVSLQRNSGAGEKKSDSLGRSGPPQAHIEGARTAMARMGLLETCHIRGEFRLAEPQRHLPLEHAAFAAILLRACSLARNHKHKSCASRLPATQEAQQFRVGLRLGFAVEIKPAVDWLEAAGESLLLPMVHDLEWLW
jgi:hypothetical protein